MARECCAGSPNASAPSLSSVSPYCLDVPSSIACQSFTNIYIDGGSRPQCPITSFLSVLSSNSDSEEVIRCLTAGAVDYLVKPLRMNELKHLWARLWCWKQVRGSITWPWCLHGRRACMRRIVKQVPSLPPGPALASLSGWPGYRRSPSHAHGCG